MGGGQATGGGGAPFSDAIALIKNGVDPTKQAILSAADITSGQTRTYSFQDRDGKVALTDQIEQMPHGLIVKGATHDRYYGSYTVQQSPTTGTSGTNVIRATPFIVTRTLTLDIIQAEVTTNIVASNFRLGIYADDGNCYPDELLLDTDSLSGAAIAVVPFAINPGLVLVPGLYWLAIVADASITFRAPNAATSGMPNILGRNAAMGINWRQPFWQVAHSYAALPNPFTAGAIVNNTASQIPEIVVRASA